MTDLQRRTVLQLAAAMSVAANARLTAEPATAKAAPTGRPGDFDFLSGEWRIHNRYLNKDQWIEFPGEATVRGILKGVASIEELRIPARDFSGMGVRVLDIERKIWTDFWVNGKAGVLTSPGQEGAFLNGVGTFTSEDTENGKPVIFRGVWDQITATSCRWSQASSRDGGKTWNGNWVMNWQRVGT